MEIKMVKLVLGEEKYEINLPISIIGVLDLEHITSTHQYLKRRYCEFLYCDYLYMNFKKDGLSAIDLKRLLRRNDIIQIIVEFNDGTQNKYNLGDFIFGRLTKDTGILTWNLKKDGTSEFQFIPAIQKNYKTSMIYGKEAKTLYDKITSWSINGEVKEDGTIVQTK